MPKTDLVFSTPIINAPGSLGFAPGSHLPVDWIKFGAFVTNPISLAPRRPAKNACCIPFEGGFLLHSGYPNPGLNTVIKQSKTSWGRSAVPVLVSLLPQSIEEVPSMVSRLENLKGVVGVEINIPPWMGVSELVNMAQAGFGELALILRISINLVYQLTASYVDELLEAGISAVSLSAPRGALPSPQGEIVYGRLFGPSLFPQALSAVQYLVSIGLPVIAGCGVYSLAQTEALLSAGATAVQLDAVLWQNPMLVGWDKINDPGES